MRGTAGTTLVIVTALMLTGVQLVAQPLGVEPVPCPDHEDCSEAWACGCDDAGNLVTRERDTDGDGAIDRRWTYTFDEEGRLLSKADDENGDGSVVDRWDYTYNAAGGLLTERYDPRSDGTVRREVTYRYQGGVLTYFERDELGDGTIDERCTYREPCADPLGYCEYDCAPPPAVEGQWRLDGTPIDLADGRLRVVAFVLWWDLPEFHPVIPRILDAWELCASVNSIPGCGSQIFQAGLDLHTNDVSLAFYTDELDNHGLEDCILNAVRNPPYQDASEAGPWSYWVAYVVSPDAGEMDRCADGVREEFEEVLSSR